MDVDKIERLVKLYNENTDETVLQLLEEAIKKLIEEDKPVPRLPYLNPVPGNPYEKWRDPLPFSPFPSNPCEIPNDHNVKWTSSPVYTNADSKALIQEIFEQLQRAQADQEKVTATNTTKSE